MRGRSVKEYDEQLTALKKENFNLKLRIYFLEERMGPTFRLDDKDDVFRKNIEYRVSMLIFFKYNYIYFFKITKNIPNFVFVSSKMYIFINKFY